MALIGIAKVVDIICMRTQKTSDIGLQLSCWRCERPAIRMIRDGNGLCARHLVTFADPHRVPTAMAMRPSLQQTTSAA